jgi:predicted RNase H-like HicB family nuclease
MGTRRQAGYYLRKDYPILLLRDPGSGAFTAELPDWPGCVSDGETIQELMENLDDARRTWVEDCIERGIEVPEPGARSTYSGKFLLRVPKAVHGRLAHLAEREGVSLNQYVLSILAEHIGYQEAQRETATFKARNL